MTIICAIYDADARKVLLGSNSGGLSGSAITPEHKTKWLRFMNWAIALSGGAVARDALEAERAKFPNQASDINQVTTYMRAAFAKFDLGETIGGAKDYGIAALAAHTSGALYAIDARLGATRIPEGALWACGSGMGYALGADSALKIKGFSPQERMETAILTAIDLDSASPGEVIVESFG